jgi:hypothetical protein
LLGLAQGATPSDPVEVVTPAASTRGAVSQSTAPATIAAPPAMSAIVAAVAELEALS